MARGLTKHFADISFVPVISTSNLVLKLTAEYALEKPVIWDATALVMRSL